jgi:SPP1 gp7 family putative phage head morphogenesis protein
MTLRNIAYDLLEFGKVSAANELGFDVVDTPKDAKNSLNVYLANIIEEQTAKLQLQLKNIANDALSNKLDPSTTQLMLENEFDSFFDKIIIPTVAALVPKTFNQGRQITFDANKEDIMGFRYTAVLDKGTTKFCRSLDGKIFKPTDLDYALLTPPNHFGCRSMWTAIRKGTKGIRFDGKPDGLPVYSSISNFQDVKAIQNTETEVDYGNIEDYLEKLISDI